MLLHIPEVLTGQALARARALLAAARWSDGRATAGAQAARVKNNEQLAAGSAELAELQALVLGALERHAPFFSAALPKRVLPPQFNRCGGASITDGAHVDQAIRYHADGVQRVRTDLSCTLFLADPDAYDGGEPVVQDTFGPPRIKLPAGDLVLYPGTSVHRVELLGRTLANPPLIAPIAYQRPAHDSGELGTALAAAARGAGLVPSARSSTPLEDVARIVLPEAQRGPLWFPLCLQGDRGFDLELVRRAAPGWDDVAWLRANTRLPRLLKGVLHPGDARLAMQHGADALIVSNHGGRTLDTALPSAWALPRITEAIDGARPLLVDGGIRRGSDVLKALALGAHAVLVGRPIVHALVVAGAHGVALALRLLRDELEIAMALCGVDTLAKVPRSLLVDASKTRSGLPGSALGDAQARQKCDLPRQDQRSTSENCFSMQQ